MPRLAAKLGWGTVTFSERGKPLIGEGYCSITHAQDLLLVAWESFPIGIDLERQRTLSEALIRRMDLNPQKPLDDWCLREAWIKLDDDPRHLFEPLAPDLHFLKLEVKEGFTGYALANRPLILESLENLRTDDI